MLIFWDNGKYQIFDACDMVNFSQAILSKQLNKLTVIAKLHGSFYLKVKPLVVKYDQCELLENTGFCILHTSAIHCDCPTYTVIIRTVHTAIITIYLHHHFPLLSQYIH